MTGRAVKFLDDLLDKAELALRKKLHLPKDALPFLTPIDGYRAVEAGRSRATRRGW